MENEFSETLGNIQSGEKGNFFFTTYSHDDQRKYQSFLFAMLRGLEHFAYPMRQELHKENKGTKMLHLYLLAQTEDKS